MADTTSGGMIEWLKENPTFSIGAGVVLVLIIAGKFMQPKTPAQTAPNADLSGLKNGLVYVPTQTSFTTENIKYGPQSNDPNLTTITNSPVNSNNPTTTTTNTGGGNNEPCPPGHTRNAQGQCVPIVPPWHHRNPPPPPPKPVAKYPIPGKSPFAYRYGEKVFQWKDPWGHLWTVGFGPSGRVWGVPGSVSDAVWRRTPIPPKTLLYQD